ncbi:MAG: glycosyltransferase involved in cell wall biosynthesis [Parasphingorhabdus sp.]|jgi:glycosyltransferase involved in cell wall biosynthesis
MNTNDTSIIVPVYNAVDTIAPCLESLLANIDKSVQAEIIVVDNGSDDGTLTKLRQFCNQVTVIEEPIKGSSAARNAGIRHSNFNILAFTDADCVVESDWLENLIAPLADPNIGIVGGTILPLPGANKIANYGQVIYDHKQAIRSFKPPFAITANWAMNRRILSHTGDFDVALIQGHDVDLAWKALEWGYRLHFEEQAVVYHHNRNSKIKLFVQGLGHGFWAVALLKNHRRLLKTWGVSRFDWDRYIRLGSDLVGLANPEERETRFLNVVFNSAKIVGRLVGAMKFRYFVL